MLPFYKPRTDQKIIDEVSDTIRSGWFTTGPKTKKFEKEIAKYSGVSDVLCVNSATSGLELVLRWFGVKEGDEVIVPVYTYCATANVVVRCGAKPVMADISNDFNINVAKIKSLITDKTKVIIPVDVAGLPCDYDDIYKIVNTKEIKRLFKPQSKEQEKLNRILILADAAHSFGAIYNGKKSGILADISVFSFHAVKNLTSGEGGAICFNLPQNFNNKEIYTILNINTLHGQNNDALAKNSNGQWEYDVISAGYKFNMTDIHASLGLVELERYDSENLPKRAEIFKSYDDFFSKFNWAELPVYKTQTKQSSMHYYPFRIKMIDLQKRNKIINHIIDEKINVNVHFKPLPLLSFYKNLGYNIKNFPAAYDNYSREISLPVFHDLTNANLDNITKAIERAVKKELC